MNWYNYYDKLPFSLVYEITVSAVFLCCGNALQVVDLEFTDMLVGGFFLSHQACVQLEELNMRLATAEHNVFCVCLCMCIHTSTVSVWRMGALRARCVCVCCVESSSRWFVPSTSGCVCYCTMKGVSVAAVLFLRPFIVRAELFGLGSGLEILDCFCLCTKLKPLLNTQFWVT